jgi:2'-5' RNA ligase
VASVHDPSASGGPSGPRLRAFIGIRLPDELADGYVALQRALASLGRVKWVERRNLHLTLKFLGTVERTDVPLLSRQLARVAADGVPATLMASRVTAFPDECAARVVVVELTDPTGSVLRLQRAIERELAALGVAADERPFRTHLTLGRVKHGKVDARAVLAGVLPPAGEWVVRAFELIESRLGADGPTYSCLKAFSTRG